MTTGAGGGLLAVSLPAEAVAASSAASPLVDPGAGFLSERQPANQFRAMFTQSEWKGPPGPPQDWFLGHPTDSMELEGCHQGLGEFMESAKHMFFNVLTLHHQVVPILFKARATNPGVALLSSDPKHPKTQKHSKHSISSPGSPRTNAPIRRGLRIPHSASRSGQVPRGTDRTVALSGKDTS